MDKILTASNHDGELLRQINRNLRGAKEYCFASGFFDLKIINEYFESIEESIQKGVNVKFLISNKVDLKVFKAIKAARENDYVKYISFKELAYFNDSRSKKLFKWINEGKISFRVVINQKGTFHYKLGFVIKDDSSVFSWNGSANHTLKGMAGDNNEQINFFKTSTAKDDDNVRLFNESWEGNLQGVFVLEIDNVLVSEIAVQLENETETLEFLNKKWDRSIYFDGILLHFIDKTKPGTYFIPQADWTESKYGYTTPEGFNKITMLNWIDDNNVYVPESTRQYLKDNISKMEQLVEKGMEIKKDWESIKMSDDFLEFKSDMSNLKRAPFDLQYKQAFFAYNLKKSLNFSVPGTGKTMVSLMTYNKLKVEGKTKRLFIIGPTSSHETWLEEFEETFGYVPKSINLSSMKSSSADDKWNVISDLNNKNYEIVLMHFATATNYYHALKKILSPLDLFVIDEAHYVKNHKGAWGEAITKLGRKASYSLLLTGTPAANGVKDINNLISITYGDAFLNFFNLSHEKDRLVSALMMRVTYKDLNMQYKQINKVIDFQLSPEQQEKINFLNKKMSDEFGGSFLETYIRKTQILSSVLLPAKVEFTKEQSNKLTEMLKIIKPSKNIVIWAKFIKSVDSIKAAIKKEFPELLVNTYYGQDSALDRVESINEYKSKGGILIANPQTLAESVSLHKNTDYTIYFEFDFNLIHWLQSRNRTFRYGMKNDMEYFIMQTSDDKVDEYVYKRLAEKQDVQENLISYNDDDLQEETMRDIKLFIEGMSI